MFVLIDHIVTTLLWWTQPSRPERPGSFSFERLQKITYTKDSSPAKTSRISSPLPALEEEAERRTEDVGALAEMVAEQRTEQKATPPQSSTPQTPQVQTPALTPALSSQRASLSTPEYIHAEVFLENMGFFTPASKRIKSRFTKEKVVGEKVGPDGSTRKVKAKISANHELGLPITSDLDYYRAFQKLCDDIVDPNGRFSLPLSVPTKRLLRYAGKRIGQNTRQEVRDWLKRMAFTGIEGGVYRAKSNDFQEGFIGTAFSQVIIRGEPMKDGKIAETNYVWLAPWFLSNFYYRHTRPIDFSFHRRLRKPIAKALYPLLETGWYASEGKPYSKSYHALCGEFLLTEHPHPSLIKQQLEPAHKELQREGFLKQWGYRKAADENGWVITYYAGTKWFADQKAREERKQLAQQRDKKPVLADPAHQDHTPLAEEERARRELLVQDILEVTGDPHSRWFYFSLTGKVREQLIRTTISEVKDAARRGEIKATRGSYFTATIKRSAGKHGITL